MTPREAPGALPALASLLRPYWFHARALIVELLGQGVAVPSDLGLDALNRAERLCHEALAQGGDYKLEYARSLLTAVRDALEVIGGSANAGADEAFASRLFSAAVRIGEADHLVYMATPRLGVRAGSDEVHSELDELHAAAAAHHKLRTSPSKRRTPWRDDVLPVLQALIDSSKSQPTKAALAREAARWAQSQRRAGRKLDFPGTEGGVERAIGALLRSGRLRLKEGD